MQGLSLIFTGDLGEAERAREGTMDPAAVAAWLDETVNRVCGTMGCLGAGSLSRTTTRRGLLSDSRLPDVLDGQAAAAESA